jgi:tetratricopeptide (TPR) repeat protein
VKTKPIPVVLVVFLAGALPVWSQLHQDRLPEFAAYLKAAGLTTLYNAEIRTLCFEHSDRAACLELARIRAGSAKQAQTTALLDSITYRDRREEIGSALLRASVLAEIGEYKEALETIEPAVDAMPAKDLLLEAILIKARCLYHLGQTDEALVNLRSIRPLVPEGRVPDLPLFLGLCEEADGNLGDAERFLEEAEAGGQPDAALALLRLALKRGDLDHFRVVADEIGAGGKEIPYQHLCDLAGEVGEILPVAWRSLMEPVIADSEFAVEMCPGVVGSLVRLAEAGEDVSGYCRTLLARPISSRSAHWLRYARAISVEDSARCDTLALLARTASVRDLRIRCIAGCLEYAGDDERTAFAGRLLPLLQGLWGDLDPSEQEEAAALVIEAGQAGPGRQRLLRLAEDLQVGYDDAALLEVAAVIEASGAVDEALAIYESLSQSPVPSEYSLRAMRSAYLLRRTGKPEEDVAGVVERVAKEGVSPFDLGDLFMDRLKDFDRAASFYRRALADPPEGVSADRVKIKLAEALAVEALGRGKGT